MEDRTIDNPNWTFRKLDKSESDYGSVTEYVFEHETEQKAVRIGKSEGGHIMDCPRGSWQVNLPRTETPDTRCFETKTAALCYAFGWVEAQQ